MGRNNPIGYRLAVRKGVPETGTNSLVGEVTIPEMTDPTSAEKASPQHVES